MKQLGAVSLATLALMSVAFVSVADGHTSAYDSTVTAKLKKNGKDADSFYGNVDSTTLRCEMDRIVNLRLRAASGPSTLVGTDVTDSVGDWEVLLTEDAAPGTYYAVAAKKVLRKNKKHRHVCTRVLSRDLTVK